MKDGSSSYSVELWQTVQGKLEFVKCGTYTFAHASILKVKASPRLGPLAPPSLGSGFAELASLGSGSGLGSARSQIPPLSGRTVGSFGESIVNS